MIEKRFNIEDGYYQGKSRPIIYDEESSDDYYFCGDYEDFKSICKQFNDFDITNKHLKKENRELKLQLEAFKDKLCELGVSDVKLYGKRYYTGLGE